MTVSDLGRTALGEHKGSKKFVTLSLLCVLVGLLAGVVVVTTWLSESDTRKQAAAAKSAMSQTLTDAGWTPTGRFYYRLGEPVRGHRDVMTWYVEFGSCEIRVFAPRDQPGKVSMYFDQSPNKVSHPLDEVDFESLKSKRANYGLADCFAPSTQP